MKILEKLLIYKIGHKKKIEKLIYYFREWQEWCKIFNNELKKNYGKHNK